MGACGPCGADGLPSPLGGPASGLAPIGGAGSSGAGFQAGPLGVVDSGGVPPRIGPAPVLLASAGNFKILTKAGISNVPTSSIIGDMGTSPIDSTAITGFALTLDGSGTFSTSAQVTGRVYAADYAPPTPAMLTVAVLAMEAAYTDAASRPPDAVNVNGGNLGGLTLGPGTYKFTGNVVVPTNLTLQGGPNDTIIIQVDGTLNVAAQVLLTGGLIKQNVVWQVAGAVTIGPGAAMKGTILAQTNIDVQTGAEVLGRLLAQTAVTLDNNLING